MENKNIIIILLVIIVVLAAAIGVMLFNQSNAKEPTKIKILTDKEQYEGGELKIKLTDLNKTPISKAVVNITITNKKGKVVVDDVVKTNSKGKAKLDLDLKKGKYKVNVTYKGNENYTGCNATQKLKIKEEVKETTSEKNSVDTSVYSCYSPKVGNYRIIETQQEIRLIETSDGNYYVITGDGIRTYDGHDSQGHIQFGAEIG